MNKTQLLAFSLIAMITLSSCGLIYGIGVQRAFATAAPDTYSVTNVIYINATGLGRAGSEIKRIEITETAKDTPIDLPMKGQPFKGIDDRPFAENTSVQFNALQSIYEHQSGDTIELFGIAVNCTGVQRIIGNTFKDAIIPVNMSDWYAMGASQPALAYPSAEKSLLFRSPYDYAHDYCTLHGYAFHSIVNSTYEQTYDMNTLNTFHSELLKTEMLVIRYNTSEADAMYKLPQYGGEQTKSPAGVALAIGLVVCVILMFVVKPLIETWMADYWDNQGFQNDLDVKYKALALGINATTYLSALAQTNKQGARTQATAMYNNNTINWEQYQYLLTQIDGSYNPTINNATVNIGKMIADYYNATSGDFQKYLDAIAFNSSWSDWIMDFIYLIAACVIAYLVIVIIGKFKGASAPAQSANVFYPPQTKLATPFSFAAPMFAAALV
jgi:hypothetical protein